MGAQERRQQQLQPIAVDYIDSLNYVHGSFGNSRRLPYGCGSLQKRGRTWWMHFRAQQGRTIRRTAETADVLVARRLLASRSIVAVEARAALLRQ